MTARFGIVPPFPRWTGVRARLVGPTRVVDGRLVAHVSLRLTHRARLWVCWRSLTGKRGGG